MCYIYLYSLPGPSWPVLGWTLPLPLTVLFSVRCGLRWIFRNLELVTRFCFWVILSASMKKIPTKSWLHHAGPVRFAGVLSFEWSPSSALRYIGMLQCCCRTEVRYCASYDVFSQAIGGRKPLTGRASSAASIHLSTASFITRICASLHFLSI